MTDLQERGDLWKWDLYKKTWSNIKTKLNPGPLHSHSCCKLPSTMIIFGGERNGEVCNDLWKFNFGMSYTFRLWDILCLRLRFRHWIMGKNFNIRTQTSTTFRKPFLHRFRADFEGFLKTIPGNQIKTNTSKNLQLSRSRKQTLFIFTKQQGCPLRKHLRVWAYWT